MNDLLNVPPTRDSTLKQVIAREEYLRLRDKLVALESATEPNLPAINAVIQALEKAQLAYKATHGLLGNNPMEDSPDI